jgi:hypothetical protein
MKIPVILLFCAGMVRAQATTGSIQPPQLGMVQEGSRLRPVYGIPAAAAVLPPLDFGHEFALVAVSPRQDYAITSDAGTGAVLLVLAGAAAPLAGAAAGPARIAISPHGSAAVLWFSSVGRLQIVSGLPGSPSVRDVSTAFLSELPSALAVSDDGALAVGSWPDGLYSFGPSGEVTRIPMRERVAALAFYSASHDLVLATRLQISKIANAGSAGAISTVYRSSASSERAQRNAAAAFPGSCGEAAAPCALLDPVGLALSWDNQRLTLAERSGSLLTVDLGSGTASRIDCGCSPDGVVSMGPSVFRITAFDGATFRLFDPAAGTLLLVPVASAQQASLQQGGGQ